MLANLNINTRPLLAVERPDRNDPGVDVLPDVEAVAEFGKP